MYKNIIFPFLLRKVRNGWRGERKRSKESERDKERMIEREKVRVGGLVIYTWFRYIFREPTSLLCLHEDGTGPA